MTQHISAKLHLEAIGGLRPLGHGHYPGVVDQSMQWPLPRKLLVSKSPH